MRGFCLNFLNAIDRCVRLFEGFSPESMAELEHASRLIDFWLFGKASIYPAVRQAAVG